MIEALRIARERISRDEEEYICYALPDTTEGKAVARIIGERISPTISLEGWLIHNGHATLCELDGNPERLRITRLAWIDSLIEELSCSKN